MKPETKTINGRVITYNDVIHHTTTTVLPFMDRLRVLFGKKIYTHSEIYCANECNTLASEAKTHCEPIFKRKYKGDGLVSIDNSKTNQDAANIV